MSRYLSSVANVAFDAEVHQAFQTSSRLGDTVTVRSGVAGDSYKFRNMGKGMAVQRPASSSDVIPMDVEHSQPTAYLTNWYAPEYTDIFDQAEVNFDERRELAQAIASALGRRKDQMILDALEDAANTETVSTTVGGAGSNMNMAKLRRASALLNANGVPNSDRYFVHDAVMLEQLLAAEQATSSDYNSVKALVNGELNSFVGFNFRLIDTRAESGLAKPTSTTTLAYAYHKAAVGYAEGIGVRQETNYIAEKVSWLSNGILKAGAVARDPDGIVKITTTDVTP